jgi:soluble cytochrome b562
MQISSSTCPQSANKPTEASMAKAKQRFEEIGTALDANNIDAAKQALAQLQQNAPANNGEGNDAVAGKVEALSKALDAGDASAAKAAYADLQQTLESQRTSHPPGGGGHGGSSHAASTGAASSTTKTYDPQDTNQDGVVSQAEAEAYEAKHPKVALDPNQATGRDFENWA